MITRRDHDRYFSPSHFRMVLSVFICVHLWIASSLVSAQEGAAQELAVNLAEGRVIICAAKDGIILATVDAHSEAGSRPPTVASLGPLRAGVILGAVEWVKPDSMDQPVRLDAEFPRLAAAAIISPGAQKSSETASDIESIGVSILERVRVLAGQLHSKINLGEDEPLVRIILADYVPGYGPEAWTLDYFVRQDQLASGYWRTRVLRPSYTQLYPPEKGQPHTLVEVRYPSADRAKDEPELRDLLQQYDPRLTTIRAANASVAKSVAFVSEGQSQKSDAASDINFLRAALPAVVPPETEITMADVDFDRGFQWVMHPRGPAVPPPADDKPQEPHAPTLRRKSEQ
jgi:hypothetical protein